MTRRFALAAAAALVAAIATFGPVRASYTIGQVIQIYSYGAWRRTTVFLNWFETHHAPGTVYTKTKGGRPKLRRREKKKTVLHHRKMPLFALTFRAQDGSPAASPKPGASTKPVDVGEVETKYCKIH